MVPPRRVLANLPRTRASRVFLLPGACPVHLTPLRPSRAPVPVSDVAIRTLFRPRPARGLSSSRGVAINHLFLFPSDDVPRSFVSRLRRHRAIAPTHPRLDGPVPPFGRGIDDYADWLCVRFGLFTLHSAL